MEEISDLTWAQHIKMDCVQFCKNCLKYIILDKFTSFWIIFCQFCHIFQLDKIFRKFIIKSYLNLKQWRVFSNYPTVKNHCPNTTRNVIVIVRSFNATEALLIQSMCCSLADPASSKVETNLSQFFFSSTFLWQTQSEAMLDLRWKKSG